MLVALAEELIDGDDGEALHQLYIALDNFDRHLPIDILREPDRTTLARRWLRSYLAARPAR